MATKSLEMIINKLMQLQILDCNILCEVLVINDEHLQLLKELETSTMPETTQH